ncbi:MAG: hypothetical protein J5850_01805, partial [Clostridia bacterium]|nr:hypothetical protein [Clostridia bacterium]
LWQLFRDCGYVAKRINLAYEDFGSDENAVVVIYSPKTDFIDKTTSQSFDEIAKLKDFLSLNNHSLYVCIDYGSQDLPVLEGFLLDSFGVKYGKEKLTDSGANSVSIDGFALSAGLNREGNGISGRVIQNSESTGGSKKTIFNIARSLDVDASKGTQILCTVPETVTNNDAGNGLLCLAETDGSGIAVISGSSNFTASYYLDSYVYLNRDLTLNLIAEMTSDAPVPSGIAFKLISNEGLDITHKQAIIWTVVITATLPLVFAVAGIVVYIRRRHS